MPLPSTSRIISSGHNEIISQLIDMGHGDIFEVYVNRVSKDAHPESQVYINIYIKRNEK